MGEAEPAFWKSTAQRHSGSGKAKRASFQLVFQQTWLVPNCTIPQAGAGVKVSQPRKPPIRDRLEKTLETEVRPLPPHTKKDKTRVAGWGLLTDEAKSVHAIRQGAIPYCLSSPGNGLRTNPIPNLL
jgi:hypothetical protein